jgi:hypothetical protein
MLYVTVETDDHITVNTTATPAVKIKGITAAPVSLTAAIDVSGKDITVT